MTATIKPPVLQFDQMSVGFGTADADADAYVTVVDKLSAQVSAGEISAIVGESGSGKTMASRAVFGLLPPGGAVTGGRILFNGRDLVTASAQEMLDIRGKKIGMVFQEPMTSLNPALTVGFQMGEALKRHYSLSESECRRRSLDMLSRVRIHDAEVCLGKYPHEFSGGMRQRVLLASVLTMEPPLLIADEPTTALDVLAQKQVLDIMQEIVREQETAVLLITHDLGLVAEYADHVTVMRHGKLIESGPVSETLLKPQHDYTKALMDALPTRSEGKRSSDQAEALATVKNVTIRYAGRRKWPWQVTPYLEAVSKVNLTIHKGETLVVVGESGSGKSTLARAILGLVPLHEGAIHYAGDDISIMSAGDLRKLRTRLQMVFQDPYSALDPRMTIFDIVAEGLRHVEGLDAVGRKARTDAILKEVGLAGFEGRFPHELSGGQRQRVNIARALVSYPEFVVADEPVSALDITVQADILALFQRLQNQLGFTCLFITHDLSVAEQIADRVVVVYQGEIVEEGTRDHIFDTPQHPYTCRLLDAAPRLVSTDEGYQLQPHLINEPAAPDERTFGAWDAKEKTERATKRYLHEVENGHYVACYET